MFVSVENKGVFTHSGSSQVPWVKFLATASFHSPHFLPLYFCHLFVCLFVCLFVFAVSDRSSWQEVLRIKSKLDFITERTHCLQPELNKMVSIPSHPPPPPSGPEPSATSHTQPVATELEPLEPFVYSSLKDWHAMAKVDHYRQLYTWEAELLSFCEQVILPKVSHLQHTDR